MNKLKIIILFILFKYIYTFSIVCPKYYSYSNLSNECIYSDSLVSSHCQGTLKICDVGGVNCDYDEYIYIQHESYCPKGYQLIRNITFQLSNPLRYYKCTPSSTSSTTYWSFGKCDDNDSAEEKGSLTVSSSFVYLNILYCYRNIGLFIETSSSNSYKNLTSKCSSSSSAYSFKLSPFYKCPIGFSSTFPCIDINECLDGTSGCSDGCINTEGSYYCTCSGNFNLGTDGKTCYPNNCLLNNGGCSDSCISIDSVVTCSCPNPGYNLSSDGKTCIDQDECSLGISGCSGGCINEIGSYHCTCPNNYQLSSDGKTCIDQDECSLGISGCTGGCINEIGSYYCTCPNNYQLLSDGKTCIDQDECSLGISGCTGGCINEIGSYHCTCPNNYQLLSDGKTCFTISISSITPSYTRGGDAIFIGSFGSVYNNISLYIGNSKCTIKNITQDQIVCDALPGTGVHSISLSINNITFIGNNIYQYINETFSCPYDCYSTLKQGICDSSTGKCNCIQPYSSFDCSIKSSNNSNNNNNNNNNNSNNQTNSFESDKLKFNIYYQSLLEVGVDGSIVRSYPLQKEWVHVHSINDQILKFQQIVNGTQCKITTSIETIKDNYKEFTFASTTFKLERNSIKLTINISNYEFTSQLNNLQLKLISSIDGLSKENDCNTKETESQDYNNPSSIFTYIKISKNNQILSAILLVDSSHETYFSITSDNDNLNSITTTFPNFKSNIILDSDFSVLLSTDFNQCESNKSNNQVVNIAVVVPVVAIVSISISVILLFKRSIYLKSKLSEIKLKNLSTRRRRNELYIQMIQNKSTTK